MRRARHSSARQAARLETVRAALDALLLTTDVVARRDTDPVSFVHRYRSDDDREVVALIAASLAFGNVAAIRSKVAIVLAALGPSPAAAIDRGDPAALAARLDGFVHRVWKGADVAAMLANAGALRRAHGSIGSAFVRFLADADAEAERSSDPASASSSAEAFLEALARLADALRGEAPSRGLRHLVPDPRAGSACKRLLLWARWMCRPADGIDLGIWKIDPGRLVIPVDTHVHRIARNLGLTARKDASMKTAAEITAALRVFDPRDPVRYDFAICHLGVSRDCPSRRDAEKCGRCVVKTACRHWRTR